jgi:hypothetical protein
MTWRDLQAEVLAEFADAATHAYQQPEVADAIVVARERNADRMRALRADPAYRRRERERERADNLCPPPVQTFVTARNGLRWTDPGNPWMADVIVEVEL